MRTGVDLMRATKPYSKEIPWRSYWGLGQSLLVHGLLVAGVLWAPAYGYWQGWMSQAVLSIFVGLSVVRLFVLFHDYCHGALFRKNKMMKPVMSIFGWYVMAVPSVWRESHNYHHRNNSKLTGSAIGSYPIVSKGVWRVLKPKQQRQIRIVRHPLFMALGLVTTFVLGMCISPFMRDRKSHWTAPVSIFTWWGAFVAIGFLVSWQFALFVWLIPGVVSSAVGSYLFYAQHNFPDAKFRGRREWDFHEAALESSSMFDMHPIMHWFTANIGYHHVHHLNHSIPYYRLPEAMKALPELQSPGRTSWAIRDVIAAFRCQVWDPDVGRMVTFAEADQPQDETASLAAAK